MITLTRTERMAIVQSYLIANTPKSLFDSLRRLSAVQRLRSPCTLAYLVAAFDRTTAKARRSEFVIALAYAYLLAILNHPENTSIRCPADSSRLLWGEQFEEYARFAFKGFQAITIESLGSPSLISSSARPARSTTLLDSAGRPIAISNHA